jgi:hypothetical protein
MDVDFGSLSRIQFSHSSGASSLDIDVHVRPALGSFLKAFQIKLGPLPAAALNSAEGAVFVDQGSFSGIATQFDNPSSEVVLSGSDTASTLSSLSTLGTVRLNVVGAGVYLIEGEIASLVVETASGQKTEAQYVPILAGAGYVFLSGRRRRASELPPVTPAHLLVAAHGASNKRRQQECNPCSAEVWGDFNGDCQFLASDVLALSQFVLRRQRFEDGIELTDPLLTHSGVHGDSCDFLRTQANPSHDLMSQAGNDPSDARYGRPAVTGLDTQHLLYATVKKYRFLRGVMDMAGCTYSSVDGSPTQAR